MLVLDGECWCWMIYFSVCWITMCWNELCPTSLKHDEVIWWRDKVSSAALTGLSESSSCKKKSWTVTNKGETIHGHFLCLPQHYGNTAPDEAVDLLTPGWRDDQRRFILARAISPCFTIIGSESWEKTCPGTEGSLHVHMGCQVCVCVCPFCDGYINTVVMVTDLGLCLISRIMQCRINTLQH